MPTSMPRSRRNSSIGDFSSSSSWSSENLALGSTAWRRREPLAGREIVRHWICNKRFLASSSSAVTPGSCWILLSIAGLRLGRMLGFMLNGVGCMIRPAATSSRGGSNILEKLFISFSWRSNETIGHKVSTFAFLERVPNYRYPPSASRHLVPGINSCRSSRILTYSLPLHVLWWYLATIFVKLLFPIIWLHVAYHRLLVDLQQNRLSRFMRHAISQQTALKMLFYPPTVAGRRRNTWNFNTGLRRLRSSRNRISDKNEASLSLCMYATFRFRPRQEFSCEDCESSQKMALDKNGSWSLLGPGLMCSQTFHIRLHVFIIQLWPFIPGWGAYTLTGRCRDIRNFVFMCQTVSR